MYMRPAYLAQEIAAAARTLALRKWTAEGGYEWLEPRAPYPWSWDAYSISEGPSLSLQRHRAEPLLALELF